MISGNNSRRLVELAFDYISTESEQQLTQNRDEATSLAPEKATFKVWLELIDYIKTWNDDPKHKQPMGRATALQFFLTQQAELELSSSKSQE